MGKSIPTFIHDSVRVKNQNVIKHLNLWKKIQTLIHDSVTSTEPKCNPKNVKFVDDDSNI
jgi:hypothetical protein